MTAAGWTIAEALAEFEAAGMPVDERQFRDLVAVLHIKRVGEVRKPPGSQGGRGPALYPPGELQHVHARNAEWLCPQEPAPRDI